MNVKSFTFKNGGSLPKRCTFHDENCSPHIEWSTIPKGTKSLAVIAVDTSAKTEVKAHWVVYNIPVTMAGLDENLPQVPKLSNGVKQGINDFERSGYAGPRAAGSKNEMKFRVFALDTVIEDVNTPLNGQGLAKIIKGHVLDSAEIIAYHGEKK